MASAAPAYRYSERAPERAPRIHVVPGRGRQSSPDGLPSSVLLLAKICAVFFVVFALVGIVRIGLASAAVTTAVSTEEITTQINSARSTGNDLEVRESYLSNPTYIKTEATKLNMAAASDTAVMVLPQDIVVTDAAGNLSLSNSLRAATQG